MLRATHVTKSFGANRAVDDVTIEIGGGEIVAIAGENGAGKTTLMRIAAGELAPDAGSLACDGRVELVHQHFMLVPALTIAENLALSSRAFWKPSDDDARAIIARTGIDLPDVTRHVGDLSVGEKAKLELIKAIARDPSVLILDEPTSVLTPREAEELFAVMRMLASRGKAVVFISHKLPEVLAVAQRVIVMRGGRVVAERNDATAVELAQAMVPGGQAILPVQDRQDCLSSTRGRILAIVGVAGNGQMELAKRLRDEHPHAAHIPEDRTRDGIVAEMSIAENLALKSKWRPRDAVRHAKEMIELYSIRARGPLQRAGSLSGGNQQKVILARELDRKPDMIVAAEPTRGLDIEATRFVHEQLRNAAADGASITLITSDLDEAFALADEIQVIYRGKLSERMPRDAAASRVANLMAGVE